MRLGCIAVLTCVRSFAQPAFDHHQHLLRSAVAPAEGFALTAADLIAQMDEAGIRRAVVLSIAYQFGDPRRPNTEDPGVDAAVGVFADAILARDKRMKHVYFEVS